MSSAAPDWMVARGLLEQVKIFKQAAGASLRFSWQDPLSLFCPQTPQSSRCHRLGKMSASGSACHLQT
ncbi:hypothetical protein NDU88_006628 [Pleurodeles waltl]|uniref:Uncharacterized protein n=1 Tax=Pleurodeles waltl TaxID=8319 RepID=A0AAV7TZ21_PLEWA|nr:hypothetical protein NDU88_006628 [Pleurodeles waltl]